MSGEQSQRSGNGSGHGDGISASEIAGSVQHHAERQFERGRDRAAEQVESTAEAIRGAARGMQGQNAWMANLVEQGADQLADLASTLRANDLPRLLTRADEFARSQPVLFAGAAFIAGLALTRAARAGLVAAPGGSARGRYDRESTGSSNVASGAEPFRGTGESGRMSLSGTSSGISTAAESTSGGSDSMPGGPQATTVTPTPNVTTATTTPIPEVPR